MARLVSSCSVVATGHHSTLPLFSKNAFCQGEAVHLVPGREVALSPLSPGSSGKSFVTDGLVLQWLCPVQGDGPWGGALASLEGSEGGGMALSCQWG